MNEQNAEVFFLLPKERNTTKKGHAKPVQVLSPVTFSHFLLQNYLGEKDGSNEQTYPISDVFAV
jgi:hypothetical protein